MRRKASQLSDEETMRILRDGVWGVLATADVGGQPYAVPMNYVLIDDVIYLHSAMDGRKIDTIMENESVSFLVVESAEVLSDKFDMSYKSSMIFGRAYFVEDDRKRMMVFKAFIEKYSPDYYTEGMVYTEKNSSKARVTAIEIQEISGKVGE